MMQPRILVVDDSRTIRTLVRRVLFRAGYDVSLAADGREAVEMARQESPDLVILDINMPDMDGYETCQKLLAIGESLRSTPIIFLTNVTAPHMDALGHELGAYLHKPVRDDLLLSTVESLLVPHASRN